MEFRVPQIIDQQKTPQIKSENEFNKFQWQMQRFGDWENWEQTFKSSKAEMWFKFLPDSLEKYNWQGHFDEFGFEFLQIQWND